MVDDFEEEIVAAEQSVHNFHVILSQELSFDLTTRSSGEDGVREGITRIWDKGGRSNSVVLREIEETDDIYI